jgi:hypothetical protein
LNVHNFKLGIGCRPETSRAPTSASTPAAGSLPDKAAKLAAVEEELLALEREEEALVARAIEQGQDVYRRPRADPRAVLGVQIVRCVPPRAPGRQEAAIAPAA